MSGGRPVAIVGAGGVGGYFAGALARSGVDVRLLARGAHLEAMRARGGLEIREPDGTRFVQDVGATDDAAGLAGAGYVIVAVKSYSLGEVAPTLRTLARSGAVIVPLLNGVSIDESLAAHDVPRVAIVGGLTYVSAARTAPGVVTRVMHFRRVVVGELSGGRSDRTDAFAAMCREAGIDAEATPDIASELWRKFAFIAPMAAACGLARRPAAAVRDAPYGRAVVEHALREVVAVGRASGVRLGDDLVAEIMATYDALGPEAKPSFLLDVERGGPTELDVLSGSVSRLGRALGVDTPIHDAAVAVLSPLSG